MALLRYRIGVFQRNTVCGRSNAMRQFLQHHGEQILGVLSGFDRLRLRGVLRMFGAERGVVGWLQQAGIALKDFLQWAEGLTQQLRCRTAEDAKAAGRPVEYLVEKVDKEEHVAKIRAQRGAADNGLIAVLSTLEVGTSFELYRYRGGDCCVLRRRRRKCLHYYYYWDDGRFGLTQVRLQTYFPFHVHVVMNGREWLARQLDLLKIGYVRQDNCFIEIADMARAQKLMDQQPRQDWRGQLSRLLRRVHPLHTEFFQAAPVDYYWTSDETEWATDVLFRDATALQDLYPALVRRAIDSFQASDVLRFLGHKVPAHGGVNGNYKGVVKTTLKRRAEGICVKHRAGKNSLKMYNKQPTVLRVETTRNDVRGMKSYRRTENDPKRKPAWRQLRKSVADLRRRADLSQASNVRYLEALSTIVSETPLSRLTDKLCRPVQLGERRFRGLRPFDPEEAKLLEIVSRGETLISGFRNREVRLALYGAPVDERERRRQAARITRKFAMLRAHGMIKKIPHTHRYTLTTEGVTAISALLAARRTSLTRFTAA
jgi:hypothetical protein